MPRRKLPIPNVRVEVQVPQDLYVRMALRLTKDGMAKIPHGVLSQYVVSLISTNLGVPDGTEHLAALLSGRAAVQS